VRQRSGTQGRKPNAILKTTKTNTTTHNVNADNETIIEIRWQQKGAVTNGGHGDGGDHSLKDALHHHPK
jgi:hypothetical protein